MSEAYNKIDGFLRNNLDDSDYEEYSEMLEELYNPSAMLQIQIETLRQRMRKMERTIEYYQSITTGFEHERIAKLVDQGEK